jgi:hypothetical protein
MKKCLNEFVFSADRIGVCDRSRCPRVVGGSCRGLRQVSLLVWKTAHKVIKKFFACLNSFFSKFFFYSP